MTNTQEVMEIPVSKLDGIIYTSDSEIESASIPREWALVDEPYKAMSDEELKELPEAVLHDICDDLVLARINDIDGTLLSLHQKRMLEESHTFPFVSLKTDVQSLLNLLKGRLFTMVTSEYLRESSEDLKSPGLCEQILRNLSASEYQKVSDSEDMARPRCGVFTFITSIEKGPSRKNLRVRIKLEKDFRTKLILAWASFAEIG